MILPAHILRKMSAKDRAALGKAGELPEQTAERVIAKSERELQLQLENLLRLRGFFPIRQRMDRKSTLKLGVPDILFAGPDGRAWAWEVKVPPNKPTAEQWTCINRMRCDGWKVAVIYSYDEALELLK